MGYTATTGEYDEFVLATRIVRADYCADGHPYTFPGNLFSTEDNRSGMTLGDVQGNLNPGEELEAMWDINGVLCVNTPRAFNISRADIVCPTKRLADGSLVHNWQPPTCEGYVDDPDPGLRMFSVDRRFGRVDPSLPSEARQTPGIPPGGRLFGSSGSCRVGRGLMPCGWSR